MAYFQRQLCVSFFREGIGLYFMSVTQQYEQMFWLFQVRFTIVASSETSAFIVALRQTNFGIFILTFFFPMSVVETQQTSIGPSFSFENDT